MRSQPRPRWARAPAMARLILACYRANIQTELEYRVDFAMRIVASLLGLVTTFGGLAVAFTYTRQIAGWTFPEALVLLAVYYLMVGIAEMFIAPGMRQVMGQVREGTFDFVLLKPVPPQLLATFRVVDFWRATDVLLGLALSIYTTTRLGLHVGLRSAIFFAMTLVAGALVIYALWLVLATLTFWFIRIENIEQIVWLGFEAGRYPVRIYPAWLQLSLRYIIPVAFIITTPAQALIGRLSAF
ncbi:MAG: ABC-2 family transporter protein, partial [Armatimonadetes bacterium]|nr:ABC-2 family transporter protein [Armatimonadota bacterium]